MTPGRRVTVAPSVYAAPLLELGDAVRAAADGGADALHLDLMDGHFVAPISFGTLVVQAVRKATTLPLDAHLMVTNPGDHLGWLALAGIRTVTVHAEAFSGAGEGVAILRAIRAAGMRAGIAMRPGTPAAGVVDAFVGEVDHVLVMTVEPGASGQPFVEAMLPKVAEVAQRFGPAVEVGVDGGIDVTTGLACVAAGATYLVAGSAVFAHGPPGVAGAIARLKDLGRAGPEAPQGGWNAATRS